MQVQDQFHLAYLLLCLPQMAGIGWRMQKLFPEVEIITRGQNRLLGQVLDVHCDCEFERLRPH